MKYIFSIISAIILSIIFPTYLLQNESVEASISKAPPTAEEKILKYMTPEEKVGQLFLFGINGTTLTPQTEEFLTRNHIGGVLLYGKNIVSEEQVKHLTAQIQTTNRIPLFISIDQEGGVVSRLKWNSTLTMAQSEMQTTEEAYTIAKERGVMLKEIGINMNLAPVVEYITDTNSFMYTRAFRGTQEEITQKGISAVNGYRESDVIAVLKHYPGHSNASPDSHFALPIVDISPDKWSEYISQFSEIIKQTDVDGIMVGHIQYPQIDTQPSSISTTIISTKLIQELGYQGLVITDDMEMGALEEMGTPIELAKQALLAGNDLLIYSTASDTETSVQQEVYDAILQEVVNGNINVDQKVLKILGVKMQYEIIDKEEN